LPLVPQCGRNLGFMKTFIDELVVFVRDKYSDLSKLTLIFPSKRASIFFTASLVESGFKNAWLPRVITLNEFVERLYPGKIVDNLTLISELYLLVKQLKIKDIESFEKFYPLGRVLLSDFNRVDAYRINAGDFYKNLKEIEEIERWSFNSDKLSERQKDFNDFWISQGKIYTEFQEVLLEKKLAYPGMASRYISENTERFFKKMTGQAFLFAGFNALSKTEQLIIDALDKWTDMYYMPDIDLFFVENDREAGYFYRKLNKKYSWPGLREIPDKFRKSKKEFRLIGVSQKSSMAQVTGQILDKINNYKNTALVLSDETLLEPILHNLPARVSEVNITMGYKLRQTPVYDLFMAGIGIQSRIRNKGIYYKDFVRFINHPYLVRLLGTHFVRESKRRISEENIIICKYAGFNDLFAKQGLVDFGVLLFEKWESYPESPTRFYLTLINKLQAFFNPDRDILELEYLFHLRKAILQLQVHLETYNIEVKLKGYQMLFREIFKNYSISFKGEPLQGLQVMGLLETRLLDFETLLVMPANEGKLPAGKGAQSFIPFDLMKGFGLPGVKEHDALNAYYFYRLINRARHISLLYSNQSGNDFKDEEPSRYLRQLEYIVDKKLVNFVIVKEQVKTEINPQPPKVVTVPKDGFYREKLKDVLQKGLSPSSLSTYLNCPLDFYFKKILGLHEANEVDEEIGADLFGNIIHHTLENLYKDYINVPLTPAIFKVIKKQVKPVMDNAVAMESKNRQTQSGLNQLNLQIIYKLLCDFIDVDTEKAMEYREAGWVYKIIALEQKLERVYKLSIGEETLEVKLHGMIDRIDQVGEKIRIIDYKTGKVDGLNSIDPRLIFTSSKYTKAMQLLVYRALYDDFAANNVETGIVGFKSLAKYVQAPAFKKGMEVNRDVFLIGLEELINEMMYDSEKSIEHNPKSTWCRFCEFE